MDNQEDPQSETPMADPAQMRRIARKLILPHVFIVAAAVAAAVFFVLPALRNEMDRRQTPEASQCAASTRLSAALAPLAHGEIAALHLAAAPEPMPALAFAVDGEPFDLSAQKGKIVLLNLWATWCVPCRQEMPALDRLQGKAGGKDFEVVALNLDKTRLERPKAFLNEVGVKNLKFYADAKGEALQKLQKTGKVVGLPTTFLVGRDGCAVGVLAGGATWDGADALALIKAAVKG